MPTKAKAALVAEATDDTTPIEFKFDGVTYSVERTALQTVAVLEALQDEKIIPLIRSIVGPAQWKTFNSKTRSVEELVKFSEVLFEAVGVSLGESTG